MAPDGGTASDSSAGVSLFAGGDGAPAPVISCRGVAKRFGGQTVLSGLDLDILPGETMVIMGGSGSGKSTTLRMMIGSFPPSEGAIELFGRDICSMGEDELNETRKKIGILFQSGALFNSMTVGENVALPLHEHTDLDPATIDIMVKIKLELVGLREAEDKYPSQISGGMKKRAGLARALALDPKILFYDEPSAGLDPVTSAQIDQLMVALSSQLGVTSVVVTHDMHTARKVADRVLMFYPRSRLESHESQVLYDGPPSELEHAEDRRVRQFVHGEAGERINEMIEGFGS
jgi:phospholipid/cholesterol/gamma-HCH transport system ATP-binding protein